MDQRDLAAAQRALGPNEAALRNIGTALEAFATAAQRALGPNEAALRNIGAATEAFATAAQRALGPNNDQVLARQFAVSLLAHESLAAQASFSPAMRDALAVQIAVSPTIRHALAPYAELSANLGHALADIDRVGTRILAQVSALDGLKGIVLDRRVAQAARAWRLGTRPDSLLSAVDSPEPILELGRGTEAINAAAYAVKSDQPPQGEPWQIARFAETAALVGWLHSISPRLSTKYKGAWSAVSHRGPDWVSQAANSAVELIDWTLRTLAPDEAVLDWHANIGKYKTEVGDNGRPTRALRVRYIAEQRAVPTSSVDHLVKSLTGTLRDLQKLKHADDEAMASALRSALIALEHALVILHGPF